MYPFGHFLNDYNSFYCDNVCVLVCDDIHLVSMAIL